MADIKKEQERDELHRAIWAIADELRGVLWAFDLFDLTFNPLLTSEPFIRF